MVYDESHVLDENELKKIIEKAVVSDAMTVYDLLSKKGIGNFINFILCSKYSIFIYFNLNVF